MHFSKQLTHVKQLAFYGIIILSLLLASLFTIQLLIVQNKLNAACSTDTPDYGTVTQTINVESNATYRAWVRLKAPNTTANSVFLEVDGTCYKMGDKSITPGQWIWVDYRDGNTNNKANVQLSKGNRTVKIIGREQNVRVDKVIFTTYTECVPLNASDECAPPADTAKPSVSITSPSNNSIVNGTINVTANANDNEGVKNVQFILDGSPVSNDTTAPYSYSLDTTKLSEGSHSIVAKVTDTSDNFVSSSPTTFIVRNNKPDLVITSLNWSPQSPKVDDQLKFTATVQNKSNTPIVSAGTVKLNFSVDGEVVATAEQPLDKLAANQNIIFTTNTTAWQATSGSHKFSAQVDVDNVVDEVSNDNNSLEASVEVASFDNVAPTISITAPTNNSVVQGVTTLTTEVNDTGGSQLSRVEFYIDNKLVATDSSSPYSYEWNTNTYEDKIFDVYARAYDNAGNTSNSERLNIEVSNAPPIPEFEEPIIEPEPETTDVEPVSEQPDTVIVELGDISFSAVDIDDNNVVDEFDLSLFFNEWGQQSETSLTVDFNSDGIVNVFDLSILLSNWSF